MSSPGQIQLKTGGDDAMMRQGHHNSGKESGGVTFPEKNRSPDSVQSVSLSDPRA